jgi:hypothetical protein
MGIDDRQLRRLVVNDVVLPLRVDRKDREQ